MRMDSHGAGTLRVVMVVVCAGCAQTPDGTPDASVAAGGDGGVAVRDGGVDAGPAAPVACAEPDALPACVATPGVLDVHVAAYVPGAEGVQLFEPGTGWRTLQVGAGTQLAAWMPDRHAVLFVDGVGAVKVLDDVSGVRLMDVLPEAPTGRRKVHVGRSRGGHWVCAQRTAEVEGYPVGMCVMSEDGAWPLRQPMLRPTGERFRMFPYDDDSVLTSARGGAFGESLVRNFCGWSSYQDMLQRGLLEPRWYLQGARMLVGPSRTGLGSVAVHMPTESVRGSFDGDVLVPADGRRAMLEHGWDAVPVRTREGHLAVWRPAESEAVRDTGVTVPAGARALLNGPAVLVVTEDGTLRVVLETGGLGPSLQTGCMDGQAEPRMVTAGGTVAVYAEVSGQAGAVEVVRAVTSGNCAVRWVGAQRVPGARDLWAVPDGMTGAVRLHRWAEDGTLLLLGEIPEGGAGVHVVQGDDAPVP